MAVKPFQKLSLIVHQDAVDAAMDTLQSTASVQIVTVPDMDEEQRIRAKQRKPSGLGESQDSLSELEHFIALLADYREPLKGLDALFTQRIAVTAEQLDDLIKTYDLKSLLTDLSDAENHLRQLNSERDDLLKTKAILTPWTSLPISIESIHQFEHAGALLCCIAQKRWNDISEKLELPVLCDVAVCSQSEGEVYLIFVYARDQKDNFHKWIEQAEIEPITLPTSSLVPEQHLKQINRRLQQLESEIQSAHDRIRDKVSDRSRLMVLRDYLASVHAQKLAEAHLLETERTALLVGWIRSDMAEDVKNRLEKAVGAFHWDLQEPVPGDEPPVVLETSEAVEPFQMVTSLYGLPDYREIDPTPYIAPTFALFFGICMSDVGYGLIIAFTTWLAIKKLPLERTVRQAMKVLFWGGIAAALFGPLCGSYLGLPFNSLPPILQKITIFPADNPMSFMIFALIVGFVHVHIGLFMGILKKKRMGLLWEGICTKLPWMILLPSLALLLFGEQMNLPPGIRSILPAVCIVASVAVIILTPVGLRNPFARVGLGLYNLYGITGFLGDVLSYSRLMAFGLVTGGIAGVINQLSMMVWKIPYAGILFAFVLLLFGHSFNIAINMLGAFVHTARLHYLEFFGKFYDGGGKSFKPLQKETRYSFVRD